jgi:hypothetical protein
MSLEDLEQEEQDRIQYEMQLAGQGGKKSKVWPSSDQGRPENTRRGGSLKVESSENYRLTLRDVGS